MKLIPPSMAARTSLMLSSSLSLGCPMWNPPMPMAETRSPVFPSVRKIIEPPSLLPPAPDCMPLPNLLARPRAPRDAIPANATPLKNSLRCIMAFVSRFLKLCSKQIFIAACCDFFLADGNTCRPRLIHAHERQRAAQERHVLAEVDHFIHALLRVLHIPEVMHHRRNARKKSGNRGCAQLWFYAQ